MVSSKLKFLILSLYLMSMAICHMPYAICDLFAQDSSKEEEALFVAKKAFADGFYDVSLGLLERFLKNYPASKKSAEANLLIGECYFHQNKFLDALSKFEELLNSPQALEIKDAVTYWIAEVHFRGNAFAKAAGYYQAIIAEFPDSRYLLPSYYSLGWCLFQESNFHEAIKYFKIVEERFSKEPQAQDASFKIIECFYNLKAYAELKDKIKSYFKIYPKDTPRLAYLYFYLAETEYYLHNFNAATDAYTKAISGTGDDKMQALSTLGMGWAYLKLKKYPEAENAFARVKSDSLEKRSREGLLLGKAIICFETDRFAEAKNVYSELINTASDPLVLVQANLGKADALYHLAQYPEAISVYQSGLDKITSDIDIPQEIVDKLHYGLAWAHLKEGEFKEAIEEFQRLIIQTPDKIIKVSALCQIGDTYQDAGNYEKAAQAYDTILKDYPDSLYSDYVQYQLGLTLLKSRNFDGAILSLKTLQKNFPASKLLDDVSYALGLAYFQRQDYNSSRETLERFALEFKDSSLRPQATYLLGTSLYNLGKFNEAIEVFKNIIRSYGQDTELLQKAEYEIADSYYQMGNEKEAMARFKILRAKYPASRLTAEVIWWLGEYYYRQNNLDLARRYFSSLIQDFPKSNLVTSAYYALGSIYEEESKYPEAVDNFKKVIELDSSDLAGSAAIAVADIYTKEDKLDLALATYQEVAKQHANLSHLVYPKMADTYRKNNDYDKALDLYRKSLEIVPVRQMADIQFKIAETQAGQGKAKEAIEDYLKVTYLYSDNQDLVVKSLLRVAAVYEESDNYREATNIYRRIVSLGVPEAKYAQERIDWIKTHIK